MPVDPSKIQVDNKITFQSTFVGVTPQSPPPPTVPVTPPTPGIAPEQDTNAWYSGSQIDGRYDWKMGIIEVPVAGPVGTQPELIRVHAPYARRIIEWTVERVGARPLLPSPNTNNPYEVLTAKAILPGSPVKDVNGVPIFRTSGRYEYAMAVTPGDNDRLSVGKAHYDADSLTLYTIQPSDFVVTFTDSSDAIPTGN